MITLRPELLKIVQAILRKHIPNHRVVLFGSRTKDTVKPYSDLDLCIMNTQPLPLKTFADLREDFSESDLPMRVDIIEWATIDPAFRKEIEQNNEEIFK